MKRPVFPLFSGDFLADTMHLNATEIGIYVLLLLHCWQHGTIPRQDRRLSLIARCDNRTWHFHRETVLQFFDIVDGSTLQHRRVTQEIHRCQEISNKRKAAALQKHSKGRAKNPDLDQYPKPEPKPELSKSKSTHPNGGAPTPDRAWAFEAKPAAQPPPTAEPASPPKPRLVDPWINLSHEIVFIVENMNGLPPDTGYLDVWRAAGIPIEIVRAIVLEGYKKSNPDERTKPLKYYDKPVREAHAKNLAGPKLVSSKSPQRGPETEQEWAVYAKIWQKFGDWPPLLGPAPGHGGCKMPAEIQRSYGFLPKLNGVANGRA
jgi:uncharacterized protein YdaU (DUF1376 family)